MSPVTVKTCSLTANEPCRCKPVLRRDACVTKNLRRRPLRHQVLPHSPEPCDCIILSFHAALSPALSNLCSLGDPWRRGPRPDPLAIAGTSSWCQRLVFGGVLEEAKTCSNESIESRIIQFTLCPALQPVCRVQ
jgi:hypothetical protein